MPDSMPEGETPDAKPVRAHISKTTRFEVFKRDKFQCQYCGAAAPKVVLHVDHIQPVVDGGGSDLLNLVTSCDACNLGKGPRLLTDDAAVTKSKKQLDLLQERREQREMMLEWKKALRDADDLDVQRLAEQWSELTGDRFMLNEHGMQTLRRLYRKWSFSDVWDSMSVAADHYFRLDKDGHVTAESQEVAFDKIGGIATRAAQDRDDPDGAEWRKAAAVLKARMYVTHAWQLTNLVHEARSAGIAVQDVWDLARHHNNRWPAFRDNLELWIRDSKKQEP